METLLENTTKIVNLQDVTLNLDNGQFYPYYKPDKTISHIYTLSNQSIINGVIRGISIRLSNLSANQIAFNNVAPILNTALKNRGFKEDLCHMKDTLFKYRLCYNSFDSC